MTTIKREQESPTCVRLEKKTRARIRRLAKSLGTSRSDVIRAAIDHGLDAME